MVSDSLDSDRSPVTATVMASLTHALGPLDREHVARAAVAVVASAFVAYGLRQFLRAGGGGYYCCNHAYFAAVGLLIAGVGWLGLIGALRPTAGRSD